jgi:deoxyadenosine/deoxycytidine kinase
MNRITLRDAQQTLDGKDYIHSLNSAYDDFFSIQTSNRVLVVDTNDLDLSMQ